MSIGLVDERGNTFWLAYVPPKRARAHHRAGWRFIRWTQDRGEWLAEMCAFGERAPERPTGDA